MRRRDGVGVLAAAVIAFIYTARQDEGIGTCFGVAIMWGAAIYGILQFLSHAAWGQFF